MILSKLGYHLHGTPGTTKWYKDNCDLTLKSLIKPESEDDEKSSALWAIRNGDIDLTINISEGTTRKDDISAGYIIRRACVDFDCSLVTNLKCAVMLAECLERGNDKYEAKHIGEFYKLPTVGWTTV
jgi:carbamoyl-phosphate synthase/aspartate carbamoyltransferase